MTMRERMARAIFDVGAKKLNSRKTWESCEQAYRDLVFEEVDAALDALKEPTLEMLRAYCEALEDPTAARKEMFHHTKARKRFRAMIQAARHGK